MNSDNTCLTNTTLRILFRRNPYSLGKCLEESAVVCEAAFFVSVHDTGAIAKKRLGDTDSSGGNILINGSTGCRFENPAYV